MIKSILFMSLLLTAFTGSAIDKKEVKEEDKITYICVAVEGYSSRAGGDIFIQASKYIKVKGKYDEENIKAAFIKKIRRQHPYFSERNKVEFVACETTKEARKVISEFNDHRHSLHTRRITFTRHDF